MELLILWVTACKHDRVFLVLLLQKQATRRFSEEICDEFASNGQKIKRSKQENSSAFTELGKILVEFR